MKDLKKIRTQINTLIMIDRQQRGGDDRRCQTIKLLQSREAKLLDQLEQERKSLNDKIQLLEGKYFSLENDISMSSLLFRESQISEMKNTQAKICDEIGDLRSLLFNVVSLINS